MEKPSRSSILGAAAALLISLGALAKEPKQGSLEDKPVPPVPADVLAEGGDAVARWLLQYGYLKPVDLCRIIGDKVCQITEGGEVAESADQDPLLAKLRSGYKSLPQSAFKVGIKPKWETVASKLTPDVLAKANRLENPRIYGINDKSELLIGDGGEEVPDFTLYQDYFQARNGATQQGLSLMTEDEYRAFNNGTMEVKKTFTWLESGEAPAVARHGNWNGRVGVYGNYPGFSAEAGGARRVLRVQ